LANVYEATASAHLAGFSDIERDFPKLDNPEKLLGASVAVLSTDTRAAVQAEAALEASGLVGEVSDVRAVSEGRASFTVTTLQVSRAQQVDRRHPASGAA